MTEVHVFIKKNHNVSISDFRFCPVPHQILVTVLSFDQLKKMSYFSICNLLLFLLVYVDSANSQQAHYYITPSLSVHCPGDPCLTLPQLAANSASYLGNETNVSLTFLPGNHSLDGELSLSHADNFSMTKVTGGNGTVFVECASQSGKFNISETTFAMIKDLHFVGCGGNKISQVEQFKVEDTIFEGVEGRGTALVLNEVTDASIARSSFLSNIHASIFEDHDIANFEYLKDILNCLYRNRNSSLAVGGAVCTTFSNVSIVSSKFTDNRAEIGGALFAHNSSLHVVGSTYSYNKASFAGVMITSESSISIKNSNFIENAAMNHGGVMIAYDRDTFSIHGTTFTNNSAGHNAGVLLIYDSNFRITDSTFSDNAANNGFSGVIHAISGTFTVIGSIFNNNSVAYRGGVMDTYNSSFNIISSTFTNNGAADDGGVMETSDSSFNITSSTFTNNSATDDGGVMETHDSSFNITSSTFTNNSAADDGGVMETHDSSFNITSSTFTNNSVADDGGVMETHDSSFNITSSTFTNNSAADDGGVMETSDSLFNITSSTFTNNSATDDGGVMETSDLIFNITSSTFTNNSADNRGGVMYTSDSSFNITCSIFTNNCAADNGGVMFTFGSSFNITSSTFTNNSAASVGGVAWALASSFNIIGSSFYANKANSYGGILVTIASFSHITNGTFDYNSGSLYIFNSNLTFSAYTRLENCTKQSNKTINALEEGGAITSFQSTVIFTGVSSLSNSQARRGGAILAIKSKIMMYGETTIANNTATVNSGGGISLQQSDLQVRGNCIISDNDAVRGGGIHATSSTIAVYQPGTLQFINNRAKNGSGLYLEANAKLYVLKLTRTPEHLLIILFQTNHAKYGGAIYVADDTNAGTCSPDNECFIQTLALHRYLIKKRLINTFFSGNTASEQGANIFGGLLDRCIPSPFAEVCAFSRPSHYSGVSYLGVITNITALDTISSLPVRVCFCKSESEPDCNYQPPTIKVKKGEAFTMPLVAVDQVNHSVDANIISSLSSQDGGFGEGQQTQSVGKNCSNVTFNVFSPHNSETINLFADGPCGSSTLSIRHLYIEFSECICPVGFQPLNSDTRCGCHCDSKLSPHIISCNSTTKSLVRVNTNSWITHINDTDPPGYIIHPNCPLDYCQLQTKNISMNLNLPDGADAQCAYNRSGVLCGGCQEYLSLSLGIRSSRCLSCHSHWPAVLVVILLAAIVAGILLVTALLALNMTVAVGLINGFIFYANIIAANNAIFFPSSEPSFPTVFVAWLNLDIGIDVCFFDGLDTYSKTWLQLAFPVYIISLVIIVIIVSEYSPRFAGLIGKRDPIATLATLILLSYSKLLSVTITALSFVVLDYPDGSRETVWLPDGNVPYFRGKHVALALVALLIILVGVPYTILLFLWQWLVCVPEWKVFKWNIKLNVFISIYHVPYNSKYRYWTGLLLLVRVVLYITASVTVSADPQTSLLILSWSDVLSKQICWCNCLQKPAHRYLGYNSIL